MAECKGDTGVRARRVHVLLGLALLSFWPGCGSTSGPGALILTPSQRSGSGQLTITAPENGRHDYTIQPIDVTAFSGGGTLEIEVRVAPNSETSGSFDLYPQGAVVTTEGRSTTSVAGAYEISKGETSHLVYAFKKGEVVRFAAEGDWFSPRGKQGTVFYQVVVR